MLCFCFSFCIFLAIDGGWHACGWLAWFNVERKRVLQRTCVAIVPVCAHRLRTVVVLHAMLVAVRFVLRLSRALHFRPPT